MYGRCNKAAEYRRNRTLLGGFQFKVEHGADEIGELDIAFRCAGYGIERCLRVGFGAACRGIGRGTERAAGELGKIAFVVMGIEGLCFLQGIEVGDVIETAVEDLLVGKPVRLDGLEYLGGTETCLAPAVVVGEFGSLCRSLFPVAGMPDSIGFLPAFVDDTTAFVAVLLLTVDDAFAFECAVEFGDGGFEYYKCHII